LIAANLSKVGLFALGIKMDRHSPNFVLFAQHGWADGSRDIGNLARSLAHNHSKDLHNIPIYAPNLGWINTWLTIAPLIAKVEQQAKQALEKFPERPWRIIAHSMGGLIWLEVLSRQQQWWERVHSFVLIGSPVAGSDLARLFDPLQLFPLIARDLAKNRRDLAEKVAAHIPTLSITSDVGNNSDGMVPISCSQFADAQFQFLTGIPHAALKNHPQVMQAILQFWQSPAIASPLDGYAVEIVRQLQAQDFTEIATGSFAKAQLVKAYPDQAKLWQWTNILGVEHIFVSVPDGVGHGDRCIYGCYVSWRDRYRLANVNF
jgi:pimeloyl-ACP methyl ester carboxylesterase